jgi:hypothetical protein
MRFLDVPAMRRRRPAPVAWLVEGLCARGSPQATCSKDPANGLPERPKGAACKTAGSAYAGSNPASPIAAGSANPYLERLIERLEPELGRRAIRVVPDHGRPEADHDRTRDPVAAEDRHRSTGAIVAGSAIRESPKA